MKLWRLNSHTHEIVSPVGAVVARLRISKTGQIALDDGESKIMHSGGGSAFGYHVTYAIRGRDTFPADDIDGELHYFTGRSLDAL